MSQPVSTVAQPESDYSRQRFPEGQFRSCRPVFDPGDTGYLETYKPPNHIHGFVSIPWRFASAAPNEITKPSTGASVGNGSTNGGTYDVLGEISSMAGTSIRAWAAFGLVVPKA